MDFIVMEREFNPSLDEQAFRDMAADLDDCATLYRAEWQESFLSQDGSRLTCCFRAPDSESIRQMARDDVSSAKVVWPGTAHNTERPELANVMVERRFAEPNSVESLQAIENAASECLLLHQVTFLRTYFSRDHKRMLCLYQAPDTESVRIAQLQAGMPVERVWACRNFTPHNL